MSHRIDLFCDDLRQKLTIIESGLQGLKAKVEANEVHAERDVRNHLDRVRIPGDTGMEHSRTVSAVRCTVFTYCSRQITLVTDCANGCSSSFEMAEIFARTSEPMLPSTRS